VALIRVLLKLSLETFLEDGNWGRSEFNLTYGFLRFIG
jgi:hypothetical protein